MDVLDMRSHAFIASKDTLASKIMAEDSTVYIPTKKDSMKSDSLSKDSLTRTPHDSLTKDSTHTHHDSLAVHKIIHGSDTMQFNQIKGRNMKGYFKDNKIYKVSKKGVGQVPHFVDARL